MMVLFFYGSIIAGMVLYGNTLSAIRKIRDHQDFEGNAVVGCVCVGFMIYAFFILLAN